MGVDQAGQVDGGHGVARGLCVLERMMVLGWCEVNELSMSFRCAKHSLCREKDSGKTRVRNPYATEIST